MPDSNDLTLLANVRRLAPSAAVVIMTALGVSEMIAGAEALGALRIVDKPIDMRDLPAIVRAAADSPQKGSTFSSDSSPVRHFLTAIRTIDR